LKRAKTLRGNIVQCSQLVARIAVIGFVASFSGCGGSDGSSVTNGAPSINLAGQIIKGPVNGAKVCAYAIVDGTKANDPLATCVNSAADGQYTINIPTSYLGDIYVQASDGSYIDESSGKTISLSSPLLSFVSAAGPKVGIVSPLTTLAVNSSATLTSAAFSTAAESVKARAGLGAEVRLTETAPTFSANSRTATNSYAAVLGGISQYMNTNGVSLGQAASAMMAADQAAFKDAMNNYASALGVASSAIPARFSAAQSAVAGSSGGSTSTPSPTVPVAGLSGSPIAPEFVGVGVKLTPTDAEIYKGETTTLVVKQTGGPTTGLIYRYFLTSAAPTATLIRYQSDGVGDRIFEHGESFVSLITGANDLGTVQVNVEVFQSTSGSRKKVGEASASVKVKDVRIATLDFHVDIWSPPAFLGLTTTTLWRSFPIDLNATKYVFGQYNLNVGKITGVARILQADALAAKAPTNAEIGACGTAADPNCDPATSYVPAVSMQTGKALYMFVRRGQEIWFGVGSCTDGRGVSVACDPTYESRLPPTTVTVYY
jgi:hypothetical protein